MQLFAQIFKVDEASRTVWGRAIAEEEDKAGECFDYATSKGPIKNWAAKNLANTDGKSCGPIREMHQPVAAGKITEIEFDDVNKAIEIAAKIVDQSSWDKVLSGVLQGFSIGGSYLKKWPATMGTRIVTKYTASPNEVSLVDAPCVESARFSRIQKSSFDLVKRDGNIVRRPFAPPHNYAHNEALLAVKKIHARGPTRPDSLLKRYTPRRDVAAERLGEAARALSSALRKAGRTLPDFEGFDTRGSMQDGIVGIKKALTFPPQSSNAFWNEVTADAGTTGSWRDEILPITKPIRIGGQIIGAPSKSNMQAALDAVRQDVARGTKRLEV